MPKVTSEKIPIAAIGDFPPEWEERTLEEVCSLVTDGTHDSPKEVSGFGYPLVTGKAIKDRRIDFSQTYKISEQDHIKVIARSSPSRNDILFANIGNSIGNLVRVQSDEQFSIKNIALFKPGKEIDPRFLEYYLLSPQVQGFIKGSTRGSAQPFIGLATLRGFPVPLPDYGTQIKIAVLLENLDKKIELNRLMNESLIDIGQTIFKSWFIDFNIIKERGQRASDGVPQGWCNSTLSTIITQNTDRVGATNATVLSAVASGELVKSDELFNKQVYSKSISKYLIVHQWHFAYNPSRINIGSCGMLKEAMIGAVSPVYVVFQCSPDFHFFVDFFLRQTSTRNWIKQLATGSVRQALSYKNFSSIPCVVPPSEIVRSFNELWSPHFNRINANLRHSETLSSIRDLLLPRLISGKLAVQDAQEYLKEAM